MVAPSNPRTASAAVALTQAQANDRLAKLQVEFVRHHKLSPREALRRAIEIDHDAALAAGYPQ
jgi:hypothetical protein